MDVDVTVVGGGPAGAAAALTLAREGEHDVLVLDRTDGGFRGGESLPPSARPVLRRLGLEAALVDGPHLPCYANQSSWGAPELWETDFLRSPWGHGWHLDRPAFDRLVLERAESAGAEVRRRVRFVDAVRRRTHAGRDAGWRVDWRSVDGAGHGTVTSRWIVDATGHARTFLRRRRVAVDRADRQVALIATFAAADGEAAARDPDTRTLLEADADGWWYSARIPGSRRIVMYFTDADLPALEALRDTSTFLAALDATRYVSRRIHAGGYASSGPLITRTAASTRATRLVGERWLAVGDAAMSFDPLSSEGVTTGLRGGEQAGAALAAALAGDRSGLARYAASIETAWARLLRERVKVYRMEPRWRHHPFWRRRAA